MKNPEQHPFFKNFEIEKLNTQNFDDRFSSCSDKIVGIFFWGHDCPNCEVAKNMLGQELVTLNNLGFKWFHVNVYEDFELGTRYGLFGIPTFLFFYQGKKLGKISPFPGLDPFFEALTKLHSQYGSRS